MKFIIVDDNQIYRESVRFLVESVYHHEVIGTASNGKEFLELKNINDADIILMDIEMPVMNGSEAAKMALWHNRSLKFIAITSYKDRAYLIDLVSSGFRACIFKDSIYDEFEATIELVKNNVMQFPKDIRIDSNKNENN
ncbi:MAG: response regulator transcription factor [Bacteroidales bacterium]|nr:response regulator transcription factor [Bacteroidales bacterium]